jgi:NADH-quinone oxidoreductase subunit J
MQTAILGLAALVILVSAFWVVSLGNLFRAALSLGLVLLGVAVVFLLLDAEFLAFTQILVYVGAILTLVIFAVMLTAKYHRAAPAPANRQVLPAALASGALFAILSAATAPVVWPELDAQGPVELAVLGQQLVTTLVLPFEVVSLVFVAAMVGAIVLATRPGKG